MYYHLNCRKGTLSKVVTIYVRHRRTKWLPIGVICKECGSIALLQQHHIKDAKLETLKNPRYTPNPEDPKK